MQSRVTRMLFLLCAAGAILAFSLENTYAVPSFARQTGLSCSACHTVYPELNTFGRHFKIMGYTMSKSTKPYEWPPPLSAVAKVSFTHTDKDQPPGSVENTWADLTNSTKNDFLFFPQLVGIYYAGLIYDEFGALVQGNYSGVEDNFFLDITDIRYADMKGDFMWGMTINNAPTLADLWNSTPAWGFPYESSPVAPTPAANPLINGELLEAQVGGIGAYGLWKNSLYAEMAVYSTTRQGIAVPLGVGTDTTTGVHGTVPYWRVALMHMWAHQALEVGTYGLIADVYPEGTFGGATNQFTDIGVDAQYQYVTGKHIFTAASTWIHEKQDWDASFNLGETSHQSDDLNFYKINLNYFYRIRLGTVGGTVGYFLTEGDKDESLYAPDPVDGSRTGSPDSSGFILEADFVLKDRHKLALQYVIYDKFNGARSNYDGYGRDASDNNTLFLLARLMF
jgi:hypothetical protein